jgi:hypothetical protein
MEVVQGGQPLFGRLDGVARLFQQTPDVSDALVGEDVGDLGAVVRAAG